MAYNINHWSWLEMKESLRNAQSYTLMHSAISMNVRRKENNHKNQIMFFSSSNLLNSVRMFGTSILNKEEI